MTGYCSSIFYKKSESALVWDMYHMVYFKKVLCLICLQKIFKDAFIFFPPISIVIFEIIMWFSNIFLQKKFESLWENGHYGRFMEVF